MNGSILYGMSRDQWCRAAEYWRATKGALPAHEDGNDIVEHWLANHRDYPAAASVIVVEGKDPLERFDGEVVSWVARSWVAIIKKDWDKHEPAEGS